MEVEITQKPRNINVEIEKSPTINVSFEKGVGGRTFTGLNDTPTTYTDQAGKLVQVNSTETGLEFTDSPTVVDWDEIGGTQSDINISGFTNDSGYLTSYTETDPVWEAEKANYQELIAPVDNLYNIDDSGTSNLMLRKTTNVLRSNALGIGFPHGNLVLNGKIYFSTNFNSNVKIAVVNDPENDLSDITLIDISDYPYAGDMDYNSSTGLIYGLSSITGKIFVLDPSDNSVSLLTTVPETNYNGSITTYGNFVYVGGTGKLYKVNITTQEITTINLTLNQAVHALKVTDDGLYVVGTQINTPTGAFIRLKIADDTFENFAINVLTPTDDIDIVGDFVYTATEQTGSYGAKINYKTLDVVYFESPRSWICSHNDGKIYTGSRDNWFGVYNISTGLVDKYYSASIAYNEMIWLNGKCYVTTYASGSTISEIEFTEDIITAEQVDLTPYVPYSGATGNVNLNSKELSGVTTLTAATLSLSGDISAIRDITAPRYITNVDAINTISQINDVGSINRIEDINVIDFIGDTPEFVTAPDVPTAIVDGPPVLILQEGDMYSAYFANGNSFQFRIYAYKEASDGTKIFSDGYLQTTLETDLNSGQPLGILLTFTKVDGAVGYYIEALQDGYMGVTNQGFYITQLPDEFMYLKLDEAVAYGMYVYGTNPDFSVTSYDRDETYINFETGVGHFAGDIDASNLSGENTGDQDSSDFKLADLSDVDKTSIGIGKILKIGLDGVTHEYVDDESGTDEKVKYDASDPTAGYIADKIIAGTGISVSEGTGADENKLIITNDAPAPEETDPVWTSDKPSYALKTEALLLDQTTPQTITATDTTITASDEIYYGDATDTFKIKKDTVQGILDLVPTPDLSGYLKLDQTTPQTIINGQPIFSKGLSVNADNEKIILGTGNDTELYFDGSNQIYKSAGYHYFYTNGIDYPITMGANSGVNKIISTIPLSIMSASIPSGSDTGIVLSGGVTDRIDFYTSGSIRLKLGSLSGGIGFYPNIDSGISLGGSSNEFFNLFIDGIAYLDEIRQNDNEKHYFGTANDASIYYDATNLIINPKEVGSGILDVKGVVQTDGYNSSDGSAGVSGSFTTTDGKTITIKDGLVTAIV